MKKSIFLSFYFIVQFFISGCGMKAHDYFVKGNDELLKYNCSQAVSDHKIASNMELEDKGDWYPIYMLGLGMSRYYCNDLDGSFNAFGVIENYTVLRSNRDGLEKGFEFLKSKGNRTYELTEREETLLHYYLGMINYKKANYEDAMVEFKKVDYIAEGNYSKLPLIALMRGLTYEKLNDHGNAFVAYKKIVEQNPESPIGYMLCYRLEPTHGNKIFWKDELQNKFNINIENISVNKKEIITIIEGHDILENNTKLTLDINNLNKNVVMLDVVQPEFDFGDFAASLLKENASKLGRDLIKKSAASLVPGGGLIAGLFFGGDDKEIRYWVNAPQVFYVDVSYLPEDNLNIVINFYSNEKLKKTKSFIINTIQNEIFITNF